MDFDPALHYLCPSCCSELQAKHPKLESDLQIMLGALLQSVLTRSCSASKACMAGLASAGTGSGFLKSGEGGIVAQQTGRLVSTRRFKPIPIIENKCPSHPLRLEARHPVLWTCIDQEDVSVTAQGSRRRGQGPRGEGPCVWVSSCQGWYGEYHESTLTSC